MICFRIQQESSGQFFVLKSGNTLSVEQHTTFFNAQADFYGSFSYPGELAWCEANLAMLKNAQYIATDIKLRTFYVILFVGGQPFKLCKINITRTNKQLLYTVYYDSTLISAGLSNTLLCSLYGAYPGVPSLESTQVAPDDMAAYMTSTTTAAPGTMPMLFAPYKNDGAYQAEGFAGPTLYKGEYNPVTDLPFGVRVSGTSPGMFYLITVDGSRDLGGGVVIMKAGYLLMLDSNNEFYITMNPYGTGLDGYPHLVFPSNPTINRWEFDASGNGSFILDNAVPSITDHECQTQAPFFYLWFVVKRVFAWFGITEIMGDAMTDPNFLRIVIWTRLAIDSPLINDVTYYMPNISVADFFKSIREEGYLVDFDLTRNVAIVATFKYLANQGEVMDLRPYQIESYRELPVTPTYYELTQPVDGDDKSFPDNYVPPTVQIGQFDPSLTVTEITITNVATNMVVEQVPVNPMTATPIVASWRVPYIAQPISRNGEFAPIVTVDVGDENNFGLRFLYYHGMARTTGGQLYPYLSVDNLDVNDTALTPFTLGFESGTGNFQPLFNYYTFIQGAKPFEQGFLLSKYIIAKMRTNMRYLVWDDLVMMPIMCLLDQGLFDLKDFQEKVPAKLQLYPLSKQTNTVQIIQPPRVPAPYFNGTVYVRFLEINGTVLSDGDSTNFYYDLYVSFWADPAGTIPKAVTRLPVIIGTKQELDIPEAHTDYMTYSSNTYTCTGINATLVTAAQTKKDFTDGSLQVYTWTYTLEPSYYFIIT